MIQSVVGLVVQLQHDSVGACSLDVAALGQTAGVCSPEVTAAGRCRLVTGVSCPDGVTVGNELAAAGVCSPDVTSADKPSAAATPVPAWHPLAAK